MSEATRERGTSEGSSVTVRSIDETPSQVTGRTITRWGWPLHRVGLAVYVLVLVVYIVRVGVPIDRIGQTGWILVGIVAARLGRPLRDHARAVLDWLPLLAALILYDHTRGIADSLGMPVRVSELVDVERSMFGGVLPTSWLQEQFSNPADPQWWDAVASLVYTSHFVVPWALAAVLYVRSRDIWMRYVHRVVLLSYAGLVTYILLPAAPPWYAAHYGFVSDEIGRIITNGWSVLGLRSAGAIIEQAQAGSNPVAALPSLHTAFALLVSITLWTLVRNRVLRVVLAAYPIAMALTLVYGGEHYVIDVLLGWLYVGLVLLVAVSWADRSTASGDPAREVTGAGGVVGPDQYPVPIGRTGDGAPDTGVLQSEPHGFELVGGARGGDGVQEPVPGSERVGNRRPAPEHPPDDD